MGHYRTPAQEVRVSLVGYLFSWFHSVVDLSDCPPDGFNGDVACVALFGKVLRDLLDTTKFPPQHVPADVSIELLLPLPRYAWLSGRRANTRPLPQFVAELLHCGPQGFKLLLRRILVDRDGEKALRIRWVIHLQWPERTRTKGWRVTKGRRVWEQLTIAMREPPLAF